MRQLKKYLLSNQRTATYVKQYLKKTNTLSKFLYKYINFGNGNFFTYLPKNIDEIKIYNFDQGGISSNNYLEAAKWLVSKMSKNKI